VTGKDEFLGRLRVALAGERPHRHRPVATVGVPPEVTPRWRDPSAPLVERWAVAFERLGGHVVRATEDGLPAALAAIVAGGGPVLVDQRFAHGFGTREDGSEADARSAKSIDSAHHRFGVDSAGDGAWLEWPGCGLDAAAAARTGVVDATAAVAATGSIVVDTSRSGRLVSLLPRVAVFVVRASTVVALPGDVLRAHATRWPDGPPSNVVFVTGPSRSGDIEMVLVIGVHGPAEVHALLVEDG
jgi:L-lactate dehydrogenase complex protein LldG